MVKTTIKNTVIFLSVALTMTLLIDHIHYTIKTEHLAEYTIKTLASQVPQESEIEILNSVETKYLKLFLVRSRLGTSESLYVFTYRMSPISHAYVLVKRVDLTNINDESVDKSMLVEQFGHKMLVLYGANSSYNIQIIRDRKLSEYLETRDVISYLYIIDDIEHLYFYYESMDKQ